MILKTVKITQKSLKLLEICLTYSVICSQNYYIDKINCHVINIITIHFLKN